MTLLASGVASSRQCDMNHLLQSLAGNQQVALKLAQLFLHMYPDKIAAFDAALLRADWIALRRVVHDLRGSCAMFSAAPCLKLANQLEEALPDHVSAELHEHCAQFRTALTNLAVELRLYLDEFAAPDQAAA